MFAFGEAKTDTLAAFADALTATNVTAHDFPATPEETTEATIGGVPARVDVVHCPPDGGVFSMTAYTVVDGQAYVFVTYDQPANEAAVRAAFGSLLQAIQLGA